MSPCLTIMSCHEVILKSKILVNELPLYCIVSVKALLTKMAVNMKVTIIMRIWSYIEPITECVRKIVSYASL